MKNKKHTSTVSRADKISPFYVMELLEKAKELERKGKHIIHMEVGEPDFGTPSAINAVSYTHLRAPRPY